MRDTQKLRREIHRRNLVAPGYVLLLLLLLYEFIDPVLYAVHTETIMAILAVIYTHKYK